MKKYRSVLDKVTKVLTNKKLSKGKRNEKAFKILNEHYGKAYMVLKQLESLGELQRHYHDQLNILIQFLLDEKKSNNTKFLLGEIKRCKEMHLDRIKIIKKILKREKFID